MTASGFILRIAITIDTRSALLWSCTCAKEPGTILPAATVISSMAISRSRMIRSPVFNVCIIIYNSALRLAAFCAASRIK